MPIESLGLCDVILSSYTGSCKTVTFLTIVPCLPSITERTMTSRGWLLLLRTVTGRRYNTALNAIILRLSLYVSLSRHSKDILLIFSSCQALV